MTRPIRWDLIEQNYDMAVKYATAIHSGTASTEAMLRRFTRNASHPTYAAMLEIGRAQRTIFVATYLRDRDQQRDTEAGLNTIENWNQGNGVICFGRGGELSSNRRDHQDKRGLTPLFWTHLAPYGEVRLDMNRRLAIRDRILN